MESDTGVFEHVTDALRLSGQGGEYLMCEAQLDDGNGGVTLAHHGIVLNYPPKSLVMTTSTHGDVLHTSEPTCTATATDQDNDELSYSYTWLDDDDNIVGTGSTYTTDQQEIITRELLNLTCRVSVNDGAQIVVQSEYVGGLAGSDRGITGEQGSGQEGNYKILGFSAYPTETIAIDAIGAFDARQTGIHYGYTMDVVIYKNDIKIETVHVGRDSPLIAGYRYALLDAPLTFASTDKLTILGGFSGPAWAASETGISFNNKLTNITAETGDFPQGSGFPMPEAPIGNASQMNLHSYLSTNFLF